MTKVVLTKEQVQQIVALIEASTFRGADAEKVIKLKEALSKAKE